MWTLTSQENTAHSSPISKTYLLTSRTLFYLPRPSSPASLSAPSTSTTLLLHVTGADTEDDVCREVVSSSAFAPSSRGAFPSVALQTSRESSPCTPVSGQIHSHTKITTKPLQQHWGHHAHALIGELQPIDRKKGGIIRITTKSFTSLCFTATAPKYTLIRHEWVKA